MLPVEVSHLLREFFLPRVGGLSQYLIVLFFFVTHLPCQVSFGSVCSHVTLFSCIPFASFIMILRFLALAEFVMRDETNSVCTKVQHSEFDSLRRYTWLSLALILSAVDWRDGLPCATAIRSSLGSVLVSQTHISSKHSVWFQHSWYSKLDFSTPYVKLVWRRRPYLGAFKRPEKYLSSIRDLCIGMRN